MKTKIEIKSFGGSVLFEFEAEDNTVKRTIEEAVKRGANLGEAYLRGAYLRGANLVGAYLRGAYLRGADLRGAENLPEEYFTMCRDDFWAVLSGSPVEIPGLRKAIVEGRIDGSTYEGECACLVGTIANVKGCNYQKLETVKANSNRPAEQFFMNIKKGDKPEKNQFSKLALGWLDEFTERMEKAFAK